MKSYSLLKKHDEVVEYIIPDPTERTHAYVTVGLFSWKLEGAHIGEILSASLTGNVPPDEELFEGIGLRLRFHGPTRYHPTPDTPIEAIKNQYELKSHGRRSGYTFRMLEATPEDLRASALMAAHYAFSYWWVLDHDDAFTPGVKRDENHWERDERLDILADVQPDGTLIYNSGEVHQAPYTLDALELHLSEDWDTPTEICETELTTVVEDLLEEYPEYAVLNGYRRIDKQHILTKPEKTADRKAADEFERQLRESFSDTDGIGSGIRARIQREFTSMDDLSEDIRAGSDRLLSLSHVGEQTEDKIIDSLIANGFWSPKD